MFRKMDDDTEENASPESSFHSRPSTSRQNEQVNEEGQLLWSLYRKHVPSTDSDRDSDASEATSDGSVQWEKNFIDKLVKVKKHSCLQERTAPASEDTRSSPERHESPLSQRLSPHIEPSNCLLNSSEEGTPKLNEDTRSSPERHEPPLSQRLSPHVEHRNCQLHSSEEGTPTVNEQLPGCSKNCDASSSCFSSQLCGPKKIRQDIRTNGHTHGELNLGYISRWEKKSPGSQRHCEVSSSSSGDSESDDERERRRERENQAGTSESEKNIESPKNCQFSSSCESDSDDSGYSNLCLRVSEDSMEDDTDHSSGREKRNKLHETSADRKDICDEVPTREHSLSPHMKKKRSSSHPGQQVSHAQLDSNQPSHRPQQWTRDSPYRGHCGRLRSQSPTDKVGRWRRSQSPVESCRKLRSRSVLPIRDTQSVTFRKRRSKSCETVSRNKKLHDSQQSSKEHVPFGGLKSVSEAPSNNEVKRQSRSRRRKWSKSSSLPGRHKSLSSSRNKSMLQGTSLNPESLPVGAATRCFLCNCSPKLQEEHTVPGSRSPLTAKRKRYLSKTWNVSEEQLTPRMRRSLSRSRIVSDTAQQESVAENVPTKLRRSMSELCLYQSEKEESLKGAKEHMRRQSMFVNTSERNQKISKKKASLKERGESTTLSPAEAFRRNKRSHRSEEDWSRSTSMRTTLVNVPRRRSRLNKFLEIEDKSTFSNTRALLMKSSEEVLLSKGKKINGIHVVDSTCSVSGSIAKRHTKSKKNQELAGDALNTEEFKGFPEEQVPSNRNLSLPAIASESCDYPISTGTLHQVHSARKIKHSESVFTHGTLSSQSKDKKVSELLGSSDRKYLLHYLTRKRKLSHEETISQDKLLTSEKLFSLLSGSCGKETYISEDISVEKHPSHKRSSRTSAGRKNQQYNSTSHSSAVNVHAAANEIPHSPSKGKFHSKSPRTNSSLFKYANAVCDAKASDTAVVKCSSQERTCYKEDNALPGTSKRIKPCSVVLKNLVFSSGYNKYVNKNEKFVFPPFPHVACLTRVSDFSLPQNYMNTMGKKASELM